MSSPSRANSSFFLNFCSHKTQPSFFPLPASPGDTQRNVVMWMDHRAAEQAARITNTGHGVLSRVGGVMSPEMQPPKLLWLKEVRGERGQKRPLWMFYRCFVLLEGQHVLCVCFRCFSALRSFFFWETSDWQIPHKDRSGLHTSHISSVSSSECERKLLEQSCSFFWPSRLPVLEGYGLFDKVGSFLLTHRYMNVSFMCNTWMSKQDYKKFIIDNEKCICCHFPWIKSVCLHNRANKKLYL